MNPIDEIRRPVEAELAEYQHFAARHLRSSDPYVTSVLEYILAGGGKAMRPLTVLLTAALHAKNPEKGLGLRAYLASMLVEMMHTASLVHDDVIDHSDLRRGKPSARAMLGSRGAVITGDLILAKSITIGLDSAQYDIVDHVVRAMTELCEGELIQGEQSRKKEMTREIYLDIVGKKTATLFAVSASAGAMAVGASKEQIAKMRELGELVGVAFQIRDDILDFTAASNGANAAEGTGKPALNDLREGKITLPLLAVLEKATAENRAELLEHLCDPTPENVEFLHSKVIARNGLDEAERVMNEYTRKALKILASYPDSPYKKSLELLVEYSGTRKK